MALRVIAGVDGGRFSELARAAASAYGNGSIVSVEHDVYFVMLNAFEDAMKRRGLTWVEFCSGLTDLMAGAYELEVPDDLVAGSVSWANVVSVSHSIIAWSGAGFLPAIVPFVVACPSLIQSDTWYSNERRWLMGELASCIDEGVTQKWVSDLGDHQWSRGEMTALWRARVAPHYVLAGAAAGVVFTVIVDAWRAGVPVEYLAQLGA